MSDFLLSCNICVSAAASVQRQCSTLSNDRKFMLDMLYSRTSPAAPLSPPTAAAPPGTSEEEGSFLAGEIRTLLKMFPPSPSGI